MRDIAERAEQMQLTIGCERSATPQIVSDALDTGAVFSECRKYRYRLWRRWAPGPHATMLAMNPSTADEVANDPTIERFVRRVHRWNAAGGLLWKMGTPQVPIQMRMQFGAVEVVNVFAWRETQSKLLPLAIAKGIDIVGSENDAAILDACAGAGVIVCAWGKPGALLGRQEAVLQLLKSNGLRLHALGINEDGTPQHPLYIGYEAPLLPYPAA